MSESIAHAWSRLSDGSTDATEIGTLSVASGRLAVEAIPMNRDFPRLDLEVPTGDYRVTSVLAPFHDWFYPEAPF